MIRSLINRNLSVLENCSDLEKSCHAVVFLTYYCCADLLQPALLLHVYVYICMCVRVLWGG